MLAHDLQGFFIATFSRKRLIAFDIGMSKIGFALSNPEKTVSIPIDVIKISPGERVIDKVMSLVNKYDPGGIVIGLPINLDSSEGEQANEVRKVAVLLSELTDIPIFLQDERFTSKIADNLLKAFDFTRQKRNQIDDKVAASVILESVLYQLKQ